MSKILVADDSLIIQAAYTQMLEFLGHEVIMCGNGLQAVNRFRETHPELVILDVDMPEMNGFDACREIRKTPDGLNIPIIMVSVGDTEEDIVNGMNAGANDYLIKPVKESHLIAKLKTFLKFSMVHRDDLELVKNHVEFAGRYTIEKLLGHGAHSVVFLAKDRENGKNVAVKLVSTPDLDSFSRAFIETAGEIKKVESPNVLKINDFGQYAGRFYVILEYAEDGDLARLLKQRKFSEEETLKLALDLIKGLKEFEKHGIVHFDIKPENIMISGNVYKLGDFGIATQRETATIPIKMEIWSTAAYLPPEYLNDSSAVSMKSDIYSLGITLYQAITGDNPFQSDKPAVAMFKQVNLVPPSLETYDRRITKYFSDSVSAMMDKNPDSRPSLDEIEKIFRHILKFLATRPPEGEKEAVADEIFQKAKKELDVITDATPSIAAKRAKPQKKTILGLTLGKLGFGRSFAIIMILAGLSTFAGFLIYNRVIDNDGQSLPGALSPVICLKCQKSYETRIMDIKNAKCIYCGGALAYRQKCYSCNFEFPSKTPVATPDNFKLKASTETNDINKCPKCGSTDTEPAPTVPDKKPSTGRK
ncbi:MAG: protein kinase [Victivallales bacterium]|jgi:serine/threonine-protein kinase